ncbi:MAG: transcriptional antiterminator RfaH [Verrucomicrobiales bacterium]|jgi:transcriptional antiterminator RfaH
MPEDEEPEPDPRWYCVHTRPKSEHIASAHLKQLGDEETIRVFCPRIRFQRNTKRGKVWFNEALFPGYTFARFDLRTLLRGVNATSAVLGVIRFGGRYPSMPEDLVEEWAETVDAEALITIDQDYEEGDEIEIVEGPMKGMQTVITKVLPGIERVNILMEMLGDAREVEVSRDVINRKGNIRLTSPKTTGG